MYTKAATLRMTHDMTTHTINLCIRLHMTEANTPGILNIFSQLRSYVLYKMSDTQGDVMRAVLIVNHDTVVHRLDTSVVSRVIIYERDYGTSLLGERETCF